jgi:hypothetical protein
LLAVLTYQRKVLKPSAERDMAVFFAAVTAHKKENGLLAH